MLAIHPHDLPTREQQYLLKQQQKVDENSSFTERVSQAATSWDNKSDKHFKIIRQHLVEMCVGIKRCNYCEDSQADEVEHIHPKALYPELAFAWDNYLLACGPCNCTYKNDRFPILLEDGTVIEPPTGKKSNGLPPPVGTKLFIDPRHEDPMLYLELELDTGLFLPIMDSGLAYQKAKWTIAVLQLNRDILCKARKVAFNQYLNFLQQYVEAKRTAKEPSELSEQSKILKDYSHPSVWREMIRSRQQYPQLNALFSVAAELL